MRKSLSRLVLVTLVLLGVAACGGGDGDASTTYLPPIREAAQLQWQDGTYVFRTAAEWEAAWNSAGTIFLSGFRPALPSIDFNQAMVVGVVAGTGPNGCSGIGLEAPREEPGHLTISYAISTGGGSSGACTQQTVPLVAFASIPQSSKPVVFVARTR